MKSRVLFVLTVLIVLGVFPVWAGETPLLSPQALEPYGLTRSWFNQIDIDRHRSKVLSLLVEGETVFVVSDDAKLHAINAQNGKYLWSRSLGSRDMLLQEPAANSRMVAVVNSLELFVLNRKNGKMLMHIGLPGAASTACEISENYVYIPMMDGKIVSFPLEDISGPKIEELDDAEGTDSTPAAQEGMEESEEQPKVQDAIEDEDEFARIARQFAEAKASIMAESAPPKKEPEIQLRKAIGIPLLTQSFGTVMVKPLISSEILTFNERNRVKVHREILTWVTARGFLMAAGINALSHEQFELQYMVDSSAQSYYLGPERIAQREWQKNKELASRPALNQCVPPLYTSDKAEDAGIPSMVIIGGKSGYVFAVRDRTGEVVWQFPTKGAIEQQIAVIGTDVYCPTVSDGMHAVDLLTGKEKWFAPNITQFIAASMNRLYVLDRKERFAILDRQTGNLLNAFDGRKFDRFYFNVETDRIYIVNDTGLIQCVHERQPQTDAEILENKPAATLRHRLSREQYAGVLYGNEVPELYWAKDIKISAEEPEGQTGDEPAPESEPETELEDPSTPENDSEGENLFDT